MTDDTIPVAFSFTVAIDGDNAPASRFHEVSGLAADLDPVHVVEGGENRFVHQLPKAVKHSNLKLKRGLVPVNSPLVQWARDRFESDLATPVKPHNLTVTLNGPDGNPVAAWAVANAWPVKWSAGNFDAMNNELAIEAIELACTTVTRTT